MRDIDYFNFDRYGLPSELQSLISTNLVGQPVAPVSIPDMATSLQGYLPQLPQMAAPVAPFGQMGEVMPSFMDFDRFGSLAGAQPQGIMGSLGSWFNQAGQWAKDSGMLGSLDTKTGLKTDGWGGMALSAMQGIGSGILGMKQYGIAKDTLATNKANFERNYAAQRTTTNTRLEDRQRARTASNAGAYESVGSYMDRNRVV